MLNNKKLCAISVILCLIVTSRAVKDYFSGDTTALESQDGYEDPHSFYYEKSMQTEEIDMNIDKIETWISSGETTCNSCNKELHQCRSALRYRPVQTDVSDELFARRLVNTLLSRATMEEENGYFHGYVKLGATESELKALRQFGAGVLTLRQVDPIFNNIVKTSVRSGSSWTEWVVISWFSKVALNLMLYAMDNKEIVTSFLLTLCIVKSLKKSNYNSLILLAFGVTIIFTLSFFITWWKLIQEAEIKHSALQMKHSTMPIHCKPETMTIFDRLSSWYHGTDECKEYHEAMLKTPFLQVTPAQAMAHMLSHTIYEPALVAADSLALFLQKLTADMNIITGTITRVTITALGPVIIVATLILLAGGSISFGNFGFLSMFTLQGANGRSRRLSKISDSKEERRPIEVILNINTNGQKVVHGITNALPLVESNGVERKAIEVATSTSLPVKVTTKKDDGGGDCKLTDAKPESDDESIKTSVNASSMKPQEIGNGDHALE